MSPVRLLHQCLLPGGNGLFAAITHLRLVVEYHAILPNKTVSCRIHCDSKVTLARVLTNITMFWCDRKVHYDHELRYGPAF
jgi:hypothetical protein